MPIADIRAAIEAELAATPEFYDFRVLRCESEGAFWRVTLEQGYVFAEGQRPGAAAAQSLLDERLEGASAWWGVPVKGGASVRMVVVEDDQLVLQNASAPPPGEGHLIRIYPPRFLNAVAEAWRDEAWARRAADGWPGLAHPQARAQAPVLDGSPFRWLRPAQRQALELVGFSDAFLWGPPGTGKTTTLGVVLAEYLDRCPDARVLLLSTTNQAVDLATLAIDKALQKGRRERWRPAVQRLGSRFDAAAYVGRAHLLPAPGTPSAQADLTNEVLAPIVHRMRLAGDPREAVPLASLAKTADFPFNARGLRVAAGRLVGEVDRVAPDGGQFWIVNEKTGGEVPVDTAFWRQK